MSDLRHKNFEKLFLYSGARNQSGLRMPLLMTGEAGTAKSQAAEQLAERLNMRFGYMAGSQQLTKSDMLGYRAPSGDIVDSLLGDFYQNGGLFVLEEMDAVNANILLNLNTAIAGSNGYFAGRMVKRHPDFVMVATANTYGGSTEDYNARTKLDASTMSRFLRVEWDLDEKLETDILKDDLLDETIKVTRKDMYEKGYALSMRDVLSYQSLLNIGIDYTEAARSTILREVETEQRNSFMVKLKVKRPSKEPISLSTEMPSEVPDSSTEETGPIPEPETGANFG